MILFVAKKTGVLKEQSWMVGDKLSDIKAAIGAGLCGAVHVDTGYGAAERKKVEGLSKRGFEIVHAKNLFTISGFLRRRVEMSG